MFKISDVTLPILAPPSALAERLSYWIWVLLGLSYIVGSVSFVVQHNHCEDLDEYPLVLTMRHLFCLCFLRIDKVAIFGDELLNL